MRAEGQFHRVSVALAKRAQSGSISVEQPGGKPMNQDDEGRKPERKSAATASSGSSPRGSAKPLAGRSKLREKGSKRGYLDGQMLIAMPTMGDERFARSVIYMCAHSSEGAMGIIVNHPAVNVSFPDLLVQLDVVGPPDLEHTRLRTEAFLKAARDHDLTEIDVVATDFSFEEGTRAKLPGTRFT